MNIEVIKGKAIGFDQMKTPTDEQLKQALAKMLPELLSYDDFLGSKLSLNWAANKYLARDTELLHLCALVEKTLTQDELRWYGHRLERVVINQSSDADWNEETGASINTKVFHATWQQRVTALAKVKGIEL